MAYNGKKKKKNWIGIFVIKHIWKPGRIRKYTEHAYEF